MKKKLLILFFLQGLFFTVATAQCTYKNTAFKSGEFLTYNLYYSTNSIKSQYLPLVYNKNMSEIKCPKCGTTFKVDDSSYADILNQVRTHEFEDEVEKRIKEALDKANSARELAVEKAKNAQAAEISELKAKLKQADTDKELAVTRALAPVEKELESVKSDLESKNSEAKLREESLKSQVKLREAALKTQYEGAIKLAKHSSSIARPNSTVFERPLLRMPISRKITMLAPVVRVISSIAKTTKTATKLSLLCLR